MANEKNDPWGRFRSRQIEKKSDVNNAKIRALQGTAAESVVQDGSVDFTELFKKIDIMVDQLSNLYNQYIAGAEKRPPVEKRKQFDQLIEFLTNVPKPTMSIKFKSMTMLTQSQTKKEHWDKLLRKLEAGKIKRRLDSSRLIKVKKD